ncbi:MAG: VacJ family lipoprotein [Caulobacter sp.]|nr:VacJ family lipoprotein [Caulobacter sp.]
MLAAGAAALAFPALAQDIAPSVSAPAEAASAVDATPVVDAAAASPDASVPQVVPGSTEAQDTAYDPLEGFNRKTFAFAMGLDRAILAPVAHGYMAVTPTPLQHRVSAVVYNLGEPATFLNDVAQGHPRRAGRTTARFAINSTIGLLGLFDVAAKMGIAPHDADFGQTLGRYGVRPGPYVYVPIIGPSSFREGVGRTVDFFTDPVGILGGGWTTTFGASRLAVQSLDTRANADGAFRVLDDAVDPYVTARSAFGQYRAAFVRQATGEVEALPDFDTPTSP